MADEQRTDNAWRAEVLDFWFNTLTPQQWFSGGAEVDKAIAERFGPLCRSLARSDPKQHVGSADDALSAILVLDQFTRNIFRGTADAFSGDPVALEIATDAIGRGFDADMPAERKQFLYMPLMHSEVLSDQELCVKLFLDLGNEDSLRYAVEHRDIVARFGRFPHRNKALGRESTDDEKAFMEGHEGYGQ